MMKSSPLFQRIRQELETQENLESTQNSFQKEFGRMLTLVVIDSSGFSRTTRKRGILHALGCISRMRDQILPILQNHHALFLRAHADNIIATFETPTFGLEALFHAHQAVQSAPIELDAGEFLGISCGMGHGEVLFAGDLEGFHGDEMNLASKLGEDLAQKNEVLITRACFQQLDPAKQSCFTENTTPISGLELTYYAAALEKLP